MGNSRKVYHDGTVVKVEGHRVKVKIISKSACAGCYAKGACSAADMQEKLIDAVPIPGLVLHAGDEVTVALQEKMGMKAVFYGFFLPFLVMVAALITAGALGSGEAIAALWGLGSLLPYYFGLYLLRSKIEKDFVFTAEKKNKF